MRYPNNVQRSVMSNSSYWTSARQQPFDAERAKQLITSQYDSVYANTTVFVESAPVDPLTMRLTQALDALATSNHMPTASPSNQADPT